MSIQKTKAEEALQAYFDDVAGGLPGIEKVAEERQSAIAAFGELGLPHRRIEAWKYTDLRAAMKTAFEPAKGRSSGVSWQAIEMALGLLAGLDAARFVLVDGAFAADVSSIDTLGEGVQVMPLAAALAEDSFADMHGSIAPVDPDHSVVALNTAFMTDGAALYIGATPARAIHIIHIVTGTGERMISTRNVVYVAKGVEATIIESFVAFEDKGAQVNSLSHIGIDEGRARAAHQGAARKFGEHPLVDMGG